MLWYNIIVITVPSSLLGYNPLFYTNYTSLYRLCMYLTYILYTHFTTIDFARYRTKQMYIEAPSLCTPGVMYVILLLHIAVCNYTTHSFCAYTYLYSQYEFDVKHQLECVVEILSFFCYICLSFLLSSYSEVMEHTFLFIYSLSNVDHYALKDIIHLLDSFTICYINCTD